MVNKKIKLRDWIYLLTACEITLGTTCLFKSKIFSGCYIGYAWRVRAKTSMAFKQIKQHHSPTIPKYFSYKHITNCGILINWDSATPLGISVVVTSLNEFKIPLLAVPFKH